MNPSRFLCGLRFPRVNNQILPRSRFGRLYSQKTTNTSLQARLIEIQKKRLSDVNEELDRLISDPMLHQRINNLKEFYEPFHHSRYCLETTPQLVSIGRALEVLKEAQSTHYVFFHGTGNNLLCLHILNNELVFQENLEELLKFQVQFRHPIQFSNECLQNMAKQYNC